MSRQDTGPRHLHRQRHRTPLVAARVAPLTIGMSAVAGGFSWDGECGVNWFDCCNIGSAQSPLWANNWTIPHDPMGCPAYPTTDDSVGTGNFTILNAQAGAGSVSVSGMGAVFELGSQAILSVKESMSVGGLFSEIKFNGGVVSLFQTGGAVNTSTSTMLEFANGGIIYGGVPGTSVENYGLITTTGSLQASIHPAVHNFGTIRPDTGPLHLYSGGTSAGLLDTAENTQLIFEFPNDQTFTILDGSQVRGHGTLIFAGGKTINQGDFGTQGVMQLTAGSGGDATLQFDVNGAANRFEHLRGTFSGDGDMNTDHFTWKAGEETGGGTTFVHTDASIGLNPFNSLLLDRELHFDAGCDAVIETPGAALLLEPNGWILNSGTLHLHDCTITSYISQLNQRLTSESSLLKDGGAGSANITTPFYSTGSIDVTSGSLTLLQPGQNSGVIAGPVHIGAGCSLIFASASQGFDPAHYSIFAGNNPTGDGTIEFTYSETEIGGSWEFPGTTYIFNGGTASFVNDWSAGTLSISGGTVTGPSNFAVNDHFIWSSGGLLYSGLNPNLGATILGDASVTGGGCTLDRLLDFVGDSTINGSIFMNAHGRVTNRGTMTLVSGGVTTNDAPENAVTNLGTMIRNGGTNQVSFTNCYNSGSVLCESGSFNGGNNFEQLAGQTVLAGGDFAGLYTHIDGGSLRGSGNVGCDFLYNNASVEPSGSINLTAYFHGGTYVQGSGGTLKIDLGGTQAGQYDTLNVLLGGAQLAGTLRVSTENNFHPQRGQQFTILTTTGGVTGQFEHVIPCNYSVTYTPTSVIVTVLSTPKIGDINCDGAVNVNDLLAVIIAWGSCPLLTATCPADIAPPGGDGQVNVNDLLTVIINWG